MKQRKLPAMLLMGIIAFFNSYAYSAEITAKISKLGFDVNGSENNVNDVEITSCQGGSCPWTSCAVVATAYNNQELLELLMIARLQNSPVTLTYQTTSGCQISSVTIKKG